MKRDPNTEIEREIETQLETALAAYADRLRAADTGRFARDLAVEGGAPLAPRRSRTCLAMGRSGAARRVSPPACLGWWSRARSSAARCSTSFRPSLVRVLPRAVPLDLTLATIALLSAAGLVVWLLEGSTNRS